MLKFDHSWRFDAPANIGRVLQNDFSELIGKIANQGDQQEILEHFKVYFAGAAGTTTSYSSSASWAQSDLDRFMGNAAQNAPLFIEAFYDACEALRKEQPNLGIPDVKKINRLLAEHETSFEIQATNLIYHDSQAPIGVPEQMASLDDQAQALIKQSLDYSEQLLSEGKNRPAIQENLWLLETVSTAFKGLELESGTIQGKYFNRIIDDLRQAHRDKTLDQILSWVTTLHGYLSSPTGRGIRHGADLKAGIATQPNEARLFCNLIRSYITFLIAEHDRLTGTQ